MSNEDRFRQRYQSGDTPWDAGQADFNLMEAVSRKPIPSCKALEIGCGTEDNSIWLARNGFQVTGIDNSSLAVEKAREKASKANVAVDFRLMNFLSDKVEGAPFGFVFDRGCFHSFSSEDDRRTFVREAAEHLGEAGLWLTIAGNADEHRRGPGPPQLTAGEIVLAVQPCFEILSLRSSHFGSNRPNPPRAWRCLMQKRPAA